MNYYSDEDEYRVSNSALIGLEYLCIFAGVGLLLVHKHITEVAGILDLSIIFYMGALVCGATFYSRHTSLGGKSFAAFVMGMLLPVGLIAVTAGISIWKCHSFLSGNLPWCT